MFVEVVLTTEKPVKAHKRSQPGLLRFVEPVLPTENLLRDM